MAYFHICATLTTSRLDLSIFTIACIKRSGLVQPFVSPASPTVSETSTAFSALSVDSTATVENPTLISEYERITYFHGTSLNPPGLLYRSDLVTNPFPLPKGRHSATPTKTAYGVFNTPLNPVWHDVAPQICDYLISCAIRYAFVLPVRIFTHAEDGKGSLGPIVIWIATHPRTTTAQDAHAASPYIIHLLEKVGVEGAVVEWFEGTVKRLAGPALLRPTLNTDPTFYVRRFLTAVLGIPIATKETEDDDAQGSLGFFFHENKTKEGNPSARVLGVSNRHVLRKKNDADYLLHGSGAPPQAVRVCGQRRFQRGINEIKALIGHLGSDAELLATEIAMLESQLASENQAEVEEAEEGLEAKRAELTEVKQKIVKLEDFYNLANGQWSDIERRDMGITDWAPKIQVNTDGPNYTLDVGTFVLDEAKFKTNFKGNVIDLGAFSFDLLYGYLV